MGRLAVILLVVLASMAIVATTTPAEAAAWSSFTHSTLTGVWVSPGIATSTFTYQISLDPGATMSFGGNTYQINWIGAFYIRSAVQGDYFTAEDSGAVADWKWEARPVGGGHDLAGWTGRGNAERLFVGGSKTVQYGVLDITGCEVNTGFHFGYQDGNQAKSGFFYGDVPATQSAPEPSALHAASLLLTGAGGLAVRRARQKRE